MDKTTNSIGDLASTAKGSGARFNGGKPPLDLVPLRLLAYSLLRASPPLKLLRFDCLSALVRLGEFQARERGDLALYEAMQELGLNEGWEECARVFDYGRRKYSEWNWSKGMPWSVPIACAARHLLAMHNFEENDPESGLPHRGHVFCNLVMLLSYMKTYPEGDDRPPAGMLP